MGVMFDTLKLAERLQAGGFTVEQSKTASLAFADSIGDWFVTQQLATKSDLKTELAEVKADIIKWVVGIGFAQVAMILAVLKLV